MGSQLRKFQSDADTACPSYNNGSAGMSQVMLQKGRHGVSKIPDEC